jgi:hypothetical protein
LRGPDPYAEASVRVDAIAFGRGTGWIEAISEGDSRKSLFQRLHGKTAGNSKPPVLKQ